MAQFSGFYGIHDRISIAQCGVVTEADEDFLYVLVFGIAAEFQCLLYDGAKILFTVLVFANVLHTVPADHVCAVDAVFVGVARAHQAVGGHENTAGKIVELFLLILPGTAEIPGEVRIFVQPRITVTGKHLSVGVDMDAGSFCLL